TAAQRARRVRRRAERDLRGFRAAAPSAASGAHLHRSPEEHLREPGVLGRPERGTQRGRPAAALFGVIGRPVAARGRQRVADEPESRRCLPPSEVLSNTSPCALPNTWRSLSSALIRRLLTLS